MTECFDRRGMSTYLRLATRGAGSGAGRTRGPARDDAKFLRYFMIARAAVSQDSTFVATVGFANRATLNEGNPLRFVVVVGPTISTRPSSKCWRTATS